MKKKLKFWLMPNAGFDSRKAIQQETAHFQKLHPGIEVVCEILPWSRAWFKLLTAFVCLIDNFGFADCKFISFTSHVLDQDG